MLWLSFKSVKTPENTQDAHEDRETDVFLQHFKHFSLSSATGASLSRFLPAQVLEEDLHCVVVRFWQLLD